MNYTTCFIVTSVIHFKNTKLSYAPTRSAFSPEERKEQTKETIQSIRRSVPGAVIVLCEQGTEDVTELAQLVDRYEYIGKHFLVRFATDSPFKGLGEIVGLLYASRILPSDTVRFFKISGRYWLNSEFDINNWVHGVVVTKKLKKTISTRLYSFSRTFITRWKISLLLSIPLVLCNISIERALFLLFPNITHTISRSGITGYIGINKEEVSE